jgi:glycerophosphoryl diester phosphodiesterase
LKLLLVLLLLCLLAAWRLCAADIIAHRGASHDALENTLASFKPGYEQQADACELLRVDTTGISVRNRGAVG